MPSPTVGADLNESPLQRGRQRAERAFRVAWNAGRERPLVGNGSGTFEYLWYERRPNLLVVRDAPLLLPGDVRRAGLRRAPVARRGAGRSRAGRGVRARRTRFAAAGLGALICLVRGQRVRLALGDGRGHDHRAALGSRAGSSPSERWPAPRPRASRSCGGARRQGVALSVFAIWSLVGNQALFAGREALGAARTGPRRASMAAGREGLLVWSAEPEIVLGDAAAGLGDRQAALRSYRKATTIDPRSWVAWLRLAQVARGPERAAAYRAVHELNPLEEGLPGE